MFSQKHFVLAISAACLILLLFIFLYEFEDRIDIFYNSKFRDCLESRPCISLCSNKKEFSDEEIKANITNLVKYRNYLYYDDDYEFEEVNNFTIHYTKLTCRSFDKKIIKDDYKSIFLNYVSFLNFS